jgi:hypothetical protein
MPESTMRGVKGLVGRVLLGGAVVFSGLVFGGCAAQRAREAYNRGLVSYDAVLEAQNHDEALALSLLGGGLAGLGAQRGKPGAFYAGQALSQHGSAMAGKSSVHQNVNVAPGQQPDIAPVSIERNVKLNSDYMREVNNPILRKEHPRFGWITIASCNYIRDFDNNGYLDFPTDYVGVKDRFREGEKITLAISLENAGNIEINLFDLNGNLVSKKSKDSAINVSEEFENLKSGNYTSAFYVNDNFVGRSDFVIEN